VSAGGGEPLLELELLLPLLQLCVCEETQSLV
jgi:hypothetical protein